jgi:hypothetical protein
MKVTHGKGNRIMREPIPTNEYGQESDIENKEEDRLKNENKS